MLDAWGFCDSVCVSGGGLGLILLLLIEKYSSGTAETIEFG